MWWLLSLLSTTLALTTDELAYIAGQGLGLSAFDNGDGSVTLSTDGTPAHDVGAFPNQNNPNSIKAERMFYKVFADPVMRAEGQEMMCLPKGPIAISISGGYIFNPFDLSVEGCPWASETAETDSCGGKPDEMGRYHYHQYSQCWGSPVCGVQSPLVGVALDGVAIYGPVDERGIQLTRHDLDKCGGRIDSVSGQYKYHVTADPPFVLGCFKAELRNDVGVAEADFVCSCPYDDTNSVKEPVCDFSGEEGDPAICSDKITEYDIRRKWVHSTPRQRLELFACCPSGQECAPLCKEPASNSNLTTCLTEQRGVTVLMNLPKTKSCWRTCYDDCISTEHCNCKRKCKRECTGKPNGSTDYRVKRGALKSECEAKNKVRSFKGLARRARNLAKRNRRKLLRN